MFHSAVAAAAAREDRLEASTFFRSKPSLSSPSRSTRDCFARVRR